MSSSAVEATCPTQEELGRLLSGQDVWQDIALLRHVMEGCRTCWAWLEENAPCLDPEAIPYGEPLSMAVLTAAMTQRAPLAGRLLLMRPQHLADARQAPRDAAAFCRLVLHEAAPASLRELKSERLAWNLGELAMSAERRIGTTGERLLQAARTLSIQQRRDLEAVAWVYRAAMVSWTRRFTEAQAILNLANELLEEGTGAWEPRVLWGCGAAMGERLMGLATSGNARIEHLNNALTQLFTVLPKLPSEGAEVQYAELLHDQADLHLALDEAPLAMQQLAVAWQLLTRQEATGLYLGSLVRFRQVQVSLAIAEDESMPFARRFWAEQAKSLLAEAQQFGLLEPEEWQSEAEQIAGFLTNRPSAAKAVSG